MDCFPIDSFLSFVFAVVSQGENKRKRVGHTRETKNAEKSEKIDGRGIDDYIKIGKMRKYRFL